jgi:hypothetical protein
MERLSNHLNERNLRAERSTPNEWQTPSSAAMQPSSQYLGWMMKIISKAISLANAPMLTEPELLVRARDWSDALHGIVPMDALNASVKRAFQDHKSTFPLNAYDLKMAYANLKAEELLVFNTKVLTTDERVARCPNKLNHIPDRFGEIEIYLPDKDAEAVVPCGACRTEEFDAAKAALMEKAA